MKYKPKMNPQQMALSYIHIYCAFAKSQERKSFQQHLDLMEHDPAYRWFCENRARTYLPTYYAYSGVGNLWEVGPIHIIVEE